jgi:hypothetical protein
MVKSPLPTIKKRIYRFRHETSDIRGAIGVKPASAWSYLDFVK